MKFNIDFSPWQVLEKVTPTSGCTAAIPKVATNLYRFKFLYVCIDCVIFTFLCQDIEKD